MENYVGLLHAVDKKCTAHNWPIIIADSVTLNIRPTMVLQRSSGPLWNIPNDFKALNTRMQHFRQCLNDLFKGKEKDFPLIFVTSLNSTPHRVLSRDAQIM